MLAWSLMVIVLTSLPYAWCALQATDDYRFGGLVYDVEDVRTYLAEMRQGANGAWLLHLPFTSEDHPRPFVHGLYLLLGKLTPLLGGSLLATFHLARAGLGLWALWAVYRFVAYFTPWVATRKVAWLLAAFSSGLGWLVILSGRSTWLGALPIDFWVPEAFTLPIIYSFPHISLSLVLLLGALQRFLQATDGRLSEAVWGGVWAFVLSFVVPFDIPIVYAAMGAYLAGLCLWRSPRWRAALRAALAVGLISLPGLLYSAWVFLFNPAFAEWSRQNLGLSPHPAHFFAAYALFLLLAVPGARRIWQRRDERVAFCLSWILAALILLYSPFNLQRRLLLGIHPTVCLLAALGLTHTLLPALGRSRAVAWLERRASRRYSRGGLRRLAIYGLLWLTLPSHLLLLAGPVVQSGGHIAPLYLRREAWAAAEWLAREAAPGSIVLSSPAVGNTLPVYSDVWVYLGHGAITARYDEKLAEAIAFYTGAAQAQAQWAGWLQQQGIAYVYWGPDERALAPGAAAGPGAASYLRLVFAEGETAIYQVALPNLSP
ncbi:MAG: hypothetical protein GX605_03220 [Chloroflexi bacterium]|nr:hypothetical protein [Chloroflexota bacterium]